MNYDRRVIQIGTESYIVIQDLLFEDCQYFLVDRLDSESHPLEEFSFVIEEKEENNSNISYLFVEDDTLKSTLAKLFFPLIADEE